MKTNKLKLIVFVGTLVLISNISYGQKPKIWENPKYGEDSVSRMQCASNLSIMSQYVKIKTYEYAYDAWRSCFDICPQSSKNIYIHGAKILKYNIEQAEDEDTKIAWADTLMMLYDKRIEYFKQEGKVYGMKGIDLLRYNKSATEEGYSYLEKSVDLSGDKTSESVIITFISTTYALMQQGVHGPDVMIGNYIKVMDILDKKLEAGKGLNKVNQALTSVEKVFSESGAADCESLVNIFTPKFAETPTDLDFLKKVTTLLSQTECEKSELYAQTAEALFKQEPSAESAAKLASLFAVKEEYAKATEYYTNAIGQQTDPEKKAMYYFQLGRIAFQQKDYPSSRKHCLAAIGLKSDMGEAYILIGDAYVSSKPNCGADEFEKSTVYWAAVDKYQKAKSVDPTVSAKANEKISLYSQYFPNNEVAFFRNLSDGNAYKVSCWINESTKVRTRKN